METNIDFNVENLKVQKKNIEDSKDKLEIVKDELSKLVDDLKSDWNNDAGAAFKEKYTGDWKTCLEKQILALEELASELQQCVEAYSDAQDDLNELKLRS